VVPGGASNGVGIDDGQGEVVVLRRRDFQASVHSSAERIGPEALTIPRLRVRSALRRASSICRSI
jgi:hypothetical protein